MKDIKRERIRLQKLQFQVLRRDSKGVEGMSSVLKKDTQFLVQVMNG